MYTEKLPRCYGRITGGLLTDYSRITRALHTHYSRISAGHWLGPVWAQLMAAALELGWFFVDPTTANLKSLAELNSELRSWMAVYLLAKVVTVAARRRFARRFLVIST